jgi:hypothetical protein
VPIGAYGTTYTVAATSGLVDRLSRGRADNAIAGWIAVCLTCIRGDPTESKKQRDEEPAMHPALIAGQRFPDLELPDHRNRAVRLSVLADGFPLILAFYRGYW